MSLLILHSKFAQYHFLKSSLREVLEQVNALVGEMFTEDVLAKKNVEANSNLDKDINDVFDWSSGLEDADDSNLYFSPEQGNVVFCSAYDGWAFSINTFSKIYSIKLGFSEKARVATKIFKDFGGMLCNVY